MGALIVIVVIVIVLAVVFYTGRAYERMHQEAERARERAQWERERDSVEPGASSGSGPTRSL